MSDAIETRTHGDHYIVQLEGRAELLHSEIASSRKDPRVNSPSVPTIVNVSRLDPKLHGKARDKLQGQALSMAAWFAFESKRHREVFNELPYLRFWKTEYQPSQRRNKSF